MDTTKEKTEENSVEVLVYHGGFDDRGEPCAKTLYLPRVPVAGDKKSKNNGTQRVCN